jgi:hypothetical protein
MQLNPQVTSLSLNTELVMDLEAKFELQKLLVSNLCDFMAAAQKWLAEPVEAGGGGGATHKLNGGPEVGGSSCCPSQ